MRCIHSFLPDGLPFNLENHSRALLGFSLIASAAILFAGCTSTPTDTIQYEFTSPDPDSAQNRTSTVTAKTSDSNQQTDRSIPVQNSESDNENQGKKKMEGGKLPPVDVIEDAEREEQPVGPHNQPAWTARHQRFATTRAYVLPPNVYELEFWGEGSFDSGERPEYGTTQELKIGLPNRHQLDFYTIQKQDRADKDFHFHELKVEWRYAFADWGEIPLNPTAYLEWERVIRSEEDKLEGKLLFADTLSDRWHWAGNLIYEENLSASGYEYGISSGINYNLVDQKFGIGAEAELVQEENGSSETKSFLGPSFEWTPSSRTSLRVVPMAGLTSDSADFKTFVIFGFEFGSGHTSKRSGTTSSDRR